MYSQWPSSNSSDFGLEQSNISPESMNLPREPECFNKKRSSQIEMLNVWWLFRVYLFCADISSILSSSSRLSGPDLPVPWPPWLFPTGFKSGSILLSDWREQWDSPLCILPPCFFNQVIERQLLVANHSQREYWYFSISFCHTQSIILWERGGKIKIISLKTTKYSIFTSRCEPEEQWSLLFISCPLFQVHGIRTYLHYGHKLLSSLLPIDPNYFNLVNIRIIHFI